MEIHIIRSILISLALGFMVGLQRAIHHLREDEKSFAGSRTFALICLMGYCAGMLNRAFSGLALATAIIVGIIVCAAYLNKTLRKEGPGSTTHMAALVTYLLGLMISANYDNYAIFIGVLMIALLEIKPKLKRFEASITQEDINAAILFLAMTFLVLPVLPDKMIGPYNLFNPYKTWLMAVVISGISFLGYAAMKILGQKKGLMLTGALGGLVSSTAVTITMSKMARIETRLLQHLAAAISLACTFMFLRVLVLVSVINHKLAEILSIPFLMATLIGLLFTYYMYRKETPSEHTPENAFMKNPLQLSEAIRFGLLFGAVYGAIAFVKSRYGDVGIYAVSFLSSITDVDAITLSLAVLQRDGALSSFTAMNGIVLASVTNSLVKLGIAWWMAGPGLGAKLTLFFVMILVSLGTTLWLMFNIF